MLGIAANKNANAVRGPALVRILENKKNIPHPIILPIPIAVSWKNPRERFNSFMDDDLFYSNVL
jgi:hypothetical protein